MPESVRIHYRVVISYLTNNGVERKISRQVWASTMDEARNRVTNWIYRDKRRSVNKAIVTVTRI